MKWMGPAAGCLGMVLHAQAGSAQPTYSVIWQFTGGADGGTPVGRVLVDPAGGLFGTVANGGANAMGAVYHLSPPANPGDAWQHDTLYSFTGADGRMPLSDLLLGKGERVLFGTTFRGGTHDSGTVFRLDPPLSGTGAWSRTTLHDFLDGSDGGHPYGGLVQCGSFLCGVATSGGNGAGLGTVFSVAQWGGATRYHVLLTFQGGAAGSNPYATLTVAGGTLLGTAAGFYGGDGGVFSLAPVPGNPPQSPWTETVLHSFPLSAAEGLRPMSPLLRDRGGTLYGTTYEGGAAGGGTVYRLVPPPTGGTVWTETVLASLPAECRPQGGLVPDGIGGLVGTTTECGRSRFGTIFRVFPPVGGGDAWRLRDLHDFTGGPDGSEPIAGLTRAGNGTFYGTTAGGAESAGTVFAITP